MHFPQLCFSKASEIFVEIGPIWNKKCKIRHPKRVDNKRLEVIHLVYIPAERHSVEKYTALKL